MWQIWLIIAGLFFIGEIITVGFLIFWFGIGALFPEFCSWVNLKTTSTPVMAKKNFVNFFAFLCCVIVCNVV